VYIDRGGDSVVGRDLLRLRLKRTVKSSVLSWRASFVPITPPPKVCEEMPIPM